MRLRLSQPSWAWLWAELGKKSKNFSHFGLAVWPGLAVWL